MIKQKSWGDCGVATLLNALVDNGVVRSDDPDGYGRIVSSLGRDNGVTMQEVCAVLYSYGLLPMYLPLKGFRGASGISTAFVIENLSITAGLVRQTSIIQVKTKSGLLHMVYCDGEKIHDPSVNAVEPSSLDSYEAVVDVVFILADVE